MPGTLGVSSTSDQDLNGLLIGVKWDTLNLTFSFPAFASNYGTGYANNEQQSNFEVLNGQQQFVARTVFAMFASVSNLTFTEIAETDTSHADLRLAMSDLPKTAYAFYPNTTPWAGDSWYRNTGGSYDAPVRGNYAFHTFIHEIGHNLGLKHGQETTVFGAMTAAHDSMEFSVMTYRSFVNAPLDYYRNEPFGYAQTLMMYDIAALQHMYGADFTTNGGDTAYRWDAATGQTFINGVGQGQPGANRIFMTVWDGGGSDTYDFSGYSGTVNVDLRPGQWTVTSLAQLAYLGGPYARGNIANALQFNGDARSLIENAVGGSGSDIIRGNDAANRLDGGAGSDTIVLPGTVAQYVFAGSLINFLATGFGVTDQVLNGEFINFSGSGQTTSIATLLAMQAGDDYRDSINDTTTTLGLIGLGGRRNGTIETDADIDVFAITLVAGARYTFDLTGSASGGGTLVDPILQLRSSADQVLATNDDFGGTRDAQITFRATASGTHYLFARGFGTTTGTYTLSAALADDFRDSATDTTTPLGLLAVNSFKSGIVELGGDVDIFRIALVSGETYTFDLAGVDGNGGSIQDPLLQLMNNAGTIMTSNDDANGSRDAQIVFTPVVTGNFLLAAQGFNASHTGSYTIRALASSDDYRDTIADSSGPLGLHTIGESQTGAVESARDADVFETFLLAGRSYTFQLDGAGGGGGSLPDPFLVLRNASGQALVANDDFGGSADALLRHTAEKSGTYYLIARSLEPQTGLYTLSSDVADDFRDSIADASTPLGGLQIGTARFGNIEETGDTDVFVVRLRAGESYLFNLTGADTNRGTNPNPYLELLHRSGAVLRVSDDVGTSNNSQIAYEARKSGLYYLAASGYSDNIGTYTLRALNPASGVAAEQAVPFSLGTGDDLLI